MIAPKIIWVVVADRASAKIYMRKGIKAELTLLHEIKHPEGRLKNRELKSDRPGVSFYSGTTARSTMDPEKDAKERVLEAFAKELALRINAAHNDGQFDELALVAEPAVLGALRQALKHHAHVPVYAEVSKNLSTASEKRVIQQLDAAR